MVKDGQKGFSRVGAKCGKDAETLKH
jgi:hypothetical protein